MKAAGKRLSSNNRGLLTGKVPLRILPPALCLLLSACATAPQAPKEPASETGIPTVEESLLEATTPEERYWQLRYTEALTAGVDDPLFLALEAEFGPPDGTVPDVPDFETYQGAGYRIASADSILKAVADLSALERVSQQELSDTLAELERDYPEAIAAIDQEILAEEILIVRSAVLDSLEQRVATDPAFQGLDLSAYQEGTVKARNGLEYVVFAREMDTLADRSIADTTGRLDAFHRMMDDNSDEAFLRERITATEEMSRQLTDEHREYANKRLVRTLFFLLPAINRYFRYR